MSVKQIQHVQKIVPIVSVQNRYSLADRGLQDVLQYCEKERMGFIPWFPLAADKLTGEKSTVGRVAEELKTTPSQVALAWLLARSPVMLPIPGTSRVAHLEAKIAAAGWQLGEKEVKELGKAASAR